LRVAEVHFVPADWTKVPSQSVLAFRVLALLWLGFAARCIGERAVRFVNAAGYWIGSLFGGDLGILGVRGRKGLDGQPALRAEDDASRARVKSMCLSGMKRSSE
jgi:hypothetical protein